MESLAPNQIIAHVELAAAKKASNAIKKLFFLAILGGIYVSLGGVFATTVAAGATGILPYGIIKLFMGLVFSLGLILIVIGGAELFTSSTLVCMAYFNKEIRFLALLKSWSVVYLGNLVGSLLTAILIFLSRQYTFGNGSIGIAAFSIANSKMHSGFLEAIILGIFCNILVCLAIWLTFGAKSTTDKIMAIILPISAFVAMGFEHSIANMFLIPIVLFIKQFDYSFILSHNIDSSNLSWVRFLFKNLIPVTIGNVIGGVFVWLSYWNIYSERSNVTQN